MLEIDEKKLIEILKNVVLKVVNLKKRKFDFLSIDSRKIKKGCIFVALKGEKFDGSDFIEDAVEKGAGCIISEKKLDAGLKEKVVKKNISYINVKNSLKALSELAVYNRKQNNARVIAITGSNGKTTTKDFIFKLLSAEYKTVHSEKSFNNHIGVPLTLLKIDADTQYAIVEMGMNHKGELRRLSKMVLPDVVVITNVAESHIGHFKSKRDIAFAKAEIFAYAKKDAFVVLNADNKYVSILKKEAGKRQVFLCGIEKKADFKICDIKETKKGYKFVLTFLGKKYSFNLNVKGKHNIYNAAFSIAVGFLEGIDYKIIKKRVNSFTLPPMRMGIRKIKGITIIDDSYNANPYSVKALIDFLASLKSASRKIFVMGDMLELGAFSKKYHREIGRYLYKNAVDSLFCYGKDARFSAETFNYISKNGRKALFFETKRELVNNLSKEIKKGDLVCFKASRAMELEKVINELEKRLEKS